MKKTDDAGLLQALDYILNRAGIREIDALDAAVGRRRKELSAETGVFSLDPERAAKEMAGAVSSSIGRAMASVRDTFRAFALSLLDKEAPELSESEKERLVSSWMPMGGGGSPRPAASLARDGKIGGVPRDMMREMALQFVAYSTGKMPASDEAALRRDIGDWPAAYWRRFPEDLQKLIRAFLSGNCAQDEFEAALSALI